MSKSTQIRISDKVKVRLLQMDGKVQTITGKKTSISDFLDLVCDYVESNDFSENALIQYVKQKQNEKCHHSTPGNLRSEHREIAKIGVNSIPK